MKKIGEYSLRGRLSHLSEHRILLFDGRFDTGWVIDSFRVFPYDFSAASNATVLGRLATVKGLSVLRQTFWDAGDNRQLAWAASNGQYEGLDASEYTFVDPDNLIIEDVYLTLLNSEDVDSNYLITMTKYDLGTDWRGALALVRNSAQNVTADS